MQIETTTARKAIDNGFLQETITEAEFEAFRQRLLKLLKQADDAVEEGESEEHLKNLIKPFFSNTNFEENYYINTKERQDLAIHNGKTRKSSVGVMIEVKRPSNKAEMITGDDLNRKAFHESILYYLRERIDNGNEDIKHIIISDIYNWYVFDAQDFERYFYESKKLQNWYQEWTQGQKVSSRTKFVYNHLEELVEELEVSIKAAHVNINDCRKLLAKNELSRKEQKKLVPLFKLFTPIYLLKQPFSGDSNELNKGFYRELLYIMGLKEYKEKGTHYITRLDKENRQHASLIENTITQLKSMSVLSRLPNRSEFGEDEQEQLFNIAIQLLITWVNRILFLKLLEAQLYKYHREEHEEYRFLNHEDLKEYDGLNKLFFQVLAVPYEERSDRINKHFGHIPYLNSSLFDVSDIEAHAIAISALEDGLEMPVYNKSKIRDREGKRLKGEKISTLEYLLRFLDAYNFNTEGTAEVQKEAKTLINASVLGRIFEKINGYKDGSFFTPGYITEYMCRETIRRAVVQKFNEAYKGWDCESINDVAARISRDEVPYSEANEIVNSITICDPAVGSGHFLVSALNELIAIKSDLRIFVDEENHRFRDLEISVDSDELSISWGTDPFFEYRVTSDWKENGYIERNVGADTQRLQKALFREKNILIENCLFGVDINPNSVNICRLRLWIELLKHAYYRKETDYQALEVLPNIDINIKQGNSLVSRFELDSNLSQILADNEDITIKDYKQAVKNYKETGNREDKQELKEQIQSIKESFKVGLEQLHPEREKLKDFKGELIKLETQKDIFGDEIEEGGSRLVRIKTLRKKINNQKEVVENLENATFYDQAFEWRFEFPEILNSNGEFSGFDVLIGNPPYVPSRSKSFTDELKNYYNSEFKTTEYQLNTFGLFIELGLKLLGRGSNYSFIVPNYWLSTRYDKKLRNHVFIENHVKKLVNVHDVFEDAVVETLLMFGYKFETEFPTSIDLFSVTPRKIKESKLRKINSNSFDFRDTRKINTATEFEELTFKKRLNVNKEYTLGDFFSFSFGLKAYQVGKGNPSQTRKDVNQKNFNSDEKKTDQHRKFLKAKNVDTLTIKGEIGWLKYGEHLAEPRSIELFSEERIVLGRIVSSERIKAIYLDDVILCNTDLITLKPKKKLDPNLVRFLLGIIVSKLTKYHLVSTNINLDRKAYPKINTKTLKDFPIPNYDEEIVGAISSVVEKAQENPEKESLEQKIDQLVYELYGLTDEEIATIEKHVS